MNTKAQTIRANLSDATVSQQPPRDDTYDADKNADIFRQTENLSKKTGLQTFIVMWGSEPVATIILRNISSQCTVLATTFVNHRRVMFKKIVRGCGYDRCTAAMEGLVLHSADHGSTKFTLADQGKRWYDQLSDAGFKVWRTL